ncbi:MAG TPA: IS30 family transposase [Acidimicrobiales bacterium]|jgi:IS30 family transposase|nr:IS30 family transposase [Acidimicrobiales bacterium]
MERLSDRERQRLVELLAEGAPAWRMHQEIHRSRWAIRRAINALQRPPKRGPQRSPLRLSLVEREEISRGVVAGESLRAIASRLGRAPSTVSREVAANGGPRRYRAARADAVALRRMRRPKSSKLAVHDELRALVESKLELKWSPEQIAGWLGEEFPDDPEMRVSHETIYLSLFVQSRGALRKELTRYLRTGRANRRTLGHSVMNGQGQLRGTINISERPAEANDRAVPGHWEGDLIFGKGMSAVATLVERKSRFVMLIQLPNGHTADVVADALAAKIVELPEQLRRSITWDQGKEMAHHARFSVATGVPVFFCDPRSPWQRGSNENTNGLLRQYFPKRSDLSPHSQADLDAVAAELNGRPRQTLGWKSPSQALDEAVAMTA